MYETSLTEKGQMYLLFLIRYLYKYPAVLRQK